ncbi:MAG: iron ABC transporter permease [Victivallaceae bacterium]|nr:iron ABC transporter permease [Victivallaceae bacterium]
MRKTLIPVILIPLAFLIGTCGGSWWISPAEWFADGSLDPVCRLRMLRQLAALVVGAALATSGGTLQTALNNPLADPFTLGISGGAALGAAIAFVTGLAAAFGCAVPICAFIGAIFALAAVAVCGRRGCESLILSGVAVATISSSALIWLVSIAPAEELAGITWWLLGDLQVTDIIPLAATAGLTLAALVLLRGLAGRMNALLLGDETAWGLGDNPHALRMVLVAISSLLTSCSVALVGIIGFVGLIVPHAVRKLHGGDHRRSIVPCAAYGGLFLMVCDLIARSVGTVAELPVGVVTSCIGGIFLVAILAGRRS